MSIFLYPIYNNMSSFETDNDGSSDTNWGLQGVGSPICCKKGLSNIEQGHELQCQK